MPHYDSNINYYVFSEIGKKSHCLDIGCWNGNLGSMLILDKQCKVDGVDSNREQLSAASSRGYSEVFEMDLNNIKTNLQNIKNKYDYIIMADVLEHLLYPDKVLLEFSKKLKKNGKIIISIPNICFILYRLKHFFGNFDYSNKGGVMDSTHVHFYSFKSATELVENSNLKIEQKYGYNQVKNRFFFLRYLGKKFPNLFAIQFIFIVKK